MKQVSQALNERAKLEEVKAMMFARIMTALAPETNEIVRANHRFADLFLTSDLTSLYKIVMAVHGAGDSTDLRYAGECARERYQSLSMRSGQSVYDLIAEEAEAFNNLQATGQQQPTPRVRSENLLQKLDDRFEPLRQQFRDQELMALVSREDHLADDDGDDQADDDTGTHPTSRASVYLESYAKMVQIIHRFAAKLAQQDQVPRSQKGLKTPTTGAAFLVEPRQPAQLRHQPGPLLTRYGARARGSGHFASRQFQEYRS
jgi:hypothetical protein